MLQVTDFQHAVVRPHIRNGLLPGFHRIREVRRVVLADLATINLFDGSFGQRFVLQIFHRLAGDLASVHEEASLSAFEQDAVTTFTGDDHFDIVGHRGPNFEAGRGVVLILNGRMSVLIRDWQLKLERRDF